MEFCWKSLSENLSQIQSAQGNAEVSKYQLAIALKISTLVLTERKIFMQQRSFNEDFQLLSTIFDDMCSHLKKTHPHEYQDLTLKSKEFADIMAFFKKRFFWQEGNYSVQFELAILGVEYPTIQTLHFSLNKNDVERLEQNLKELEPFLGKYIHPPADGKAPDGIWNWAYPLFKESTS